MPISDHRGNNQSSVFDVYRFIFGREGLNLDWLVGQTNESLDARLQLNWKQGHENMRYRTVLASASGIMSHRASYFDLDTDNRTLALKASCAIPILNRQPIFLRMSIGLTVGCVRQSQFKKPTSEDIVILLLSELYLLMCNMIIVG